MSGVNKDERKRERDLMVYQIAQQVCVFSTSYSEAEGILNDTLFLLERMKSRQKPTAPEVPEDKWGNKLDLPAVKENCLEPIAPGIMEKIKEAIQQPQY